MNFIYNHIGGPLVKADYRYLLFLVLMTFLSTAGWLVGMRVL